MADGVPNSYLPLLRTQSARPQADADGLPPQIRQLTATPGGGSHAISEALIQLADGLQGQPGGRAALDKALEAARPYMDPREWEFTKVTVQGKQIVSELKAKAVEQQQIEEARQRAEFMAAIVREATVALERQQRQAIFSQLADSELARHLQSVKKRHIV